MSQKILSASSLVRSVDLGAFFSRHKAGQDRKSISWPGLAHALANFAIRAPKKHAGSASLAVLIRHKLIELPMLQAGLLNPLFASSRKD